jgi:hypothetical protein
MGEIIVSLLMLGGATTLIYIALSGLKPPKNRGSNHPSRRLENS